MQDLGFWMSRESDAILQRTMPASQNETVMKKHRDVVFMFDESEPGVIGMKHEQVDTCVTVSPVTIRRWY